MLAGDAETADTKFRNNRQKIAELAHQKREMTASTLRVANPVLCSNGERE